MASTSLGVMEQSIALPDDPAALRALIAAQQARLAEIEVERETQRGRNWTFAGSDAGGARAAAIYSLIETAKINGADPEAYLRHVIERIADHPVNRVADLLPWNLTDLRQRLDQRAA